MKYGLQLLEDKLVDLQNQLTIYAQQREDLFTQIAVVNDKIVKAQARYDSLVLMTTALNKLPIGDDSE